MAQLIPLQATPSQTFTVQLGTQLCQINVYQRTPGLFLDLYANGNLIVSGVLCLNLNWIVRSPYLGFLGDLEFQDNQGSADPVYSGLGTQFVLWWLEPTDLPANYGQSLVF